MDGAKVILFHNDDIIREFETKNVCQTNEDCEKCSIEKKSETEQTAENVSYKKRLQKLLIDDWSQSKLPQERVQPFQTELLTLTRPLNKKCG